MRRRRGACSGAAGSAPRCRASQARARALDDDISARADRAKDVNMRAAIFWYFVRRLTDRTLRYYRPALILGTFRGPARPLLSACTGNRRGRALFPK